MTKHKESRPAANQKMPHGHFNKEGLSQGKQSGANRPADAYQGERKERESTHKKER